MQCYQHQGMICNDSFLYFLQYGQILEIVKQPFFKDRIIEFCGECNKSYHIHKFNMAIITHNKETMRRAYNMLAFDPEI